MPRRWSRRAAAAVMGGASLVLATDHASASDDVPRLELDYAAPAECSSRDAFEALVRARLPSNVAARMTDARRFEVHIARIESGRYTGRLDVHGSAFEPNVREIGAASCAVVGHVARRLSRSRAGSRVGAGRFDEAGGAFAHRRACDASAGNASPRRGRRAARITAGCSLALDVGPPRDASPCSGRCMGRAYPHGDRARSSA